jgi:dTDP-4-amino-4,6-dideoxygalactose transaminase
MPVPSFAGYRAFWTASGTAALALAITWAIRNARNPQSAKVILPAYGCPDLVSAVLHAGAAPILVDTLPGDPGFDIDALARVMDSSVVAIVAVNFLGIRERHAELRSLARACGAWLIEDRAQALPDSETALMGDAVVLSFGRGKPVNLLGGGAVLLQQRLVGGIDSASVAPFEAAAELAPRRIRSNWPFRMRAALYNVLAAPRLYRLAARVPVFGIGVTRYRALRAIEGLDDVRLRYLGVNAACWLSRDRWRERLLSDEIGRFPQVDPLPVRLTDRTERLLRYPVLMPSQTSRDEALRSLKEHGLGASEFYGRPLPRVPGVPPAVAAQGVFPNAQDFASRLLVLPVHDSVREWHIRRSLEIVAAVIGGSERGSRP